MRLKYKEQAVGDDFTVLGYRFTGPLILHSNPVSQNQSLTKAKVDSDLSQLNVGIISGLIPAKLIPKFSGDVSHTAGTSVFNLTLTGLTAGTYTVLEVGKDGRVYSGRNLEESDIPTLNWSKVSKGRPSTLAGFGILDALSTSGGTVGSQFKLSGTPTDPLHIVNRGYIDGLTGEGNVLEVGTIIMSSSINAPDGYLRANGSRVLKSSYPDLYSLIGDEHWSGRNFLGYGRPWDQRYGMPMLTLTAVSTTTITITTNLNMYQMNSANFSVVGKGYVIGGKSIHNSSMVSYAPAGISNHWEYVVENKGYMSNITTSSHNFPLDIDYVHILARSRPIYFNQTGVSYSAGGYQSGNGVETTFPSFTLEWVGSDYSDRSGQYMVIVKPIGSSSGNSVIGSYSATRAGNVSYSFGAGSSSERRTPKAVGYNVYPDPSTYTYTTQTGSPYTWSGIRGSIPTDNTDSVTVVNDPNNKILTFSSSNHYASSLRYPLYSQAIADRFIIGERLEFSQPLVYNGKVYLLGGESNGVVTDKIYISSLNPAGTEVGQWNSSSTLPEGLSEGSAFLYSKRIYYVGGRTEFGISDKIYVGDIASNGNISNWRQAAVLPKALYGTSLMLLGTEVIIMMGVGVSGNNSTVYRTEITASGTLRDITSVGNLPVAPGVASTIVSGTSFFSVTKDRDMTGIFRNGSIEDFNAKTVTGGAIKRTLYHNGQYVFIRTFNSTGVPSDLRTNLNFSIGLDDLYQNDNVEFINENEFNLPDLSSGNPEYDYMIKAL